MRARIALLAGGAAVAVAALHRLRRRKPVAPPPLAEPEPGPDPRVEELREKLAASRDVVDERDAAEEFETPVDEAVADGDAEVEARRQDVHARGRATVAEMDQEQT